MAAPPFSSSSFPLRNPAQPMLSASFNLIAVQTRLRKSTAPRVSIAVSSPKITSNPIKHASLCFLPIRCSASCNPSSDNDDGGGRPTPSARIFTKGLSRSTSEGTLANLFSCFGEIRKVKIITSKGYKDSLGLAYIWFECEEDALLAVKEMDGKFVDGRFVAVMMARPEAPSKQVRTRLYRFR